VEVDIDEDLTWNLDGISIHFSFDQTIRCDQLFPGVCDDIHADGFESCLDPNAPDFSDWLQ